MSEAGRARREDHRAARRGARRVGERTAPPRRAAQHQVGRDDWVDDDLRRVAELADEALEIARGVERRPSLAAALHRKLFIPTGPDASAERLRLARRDAALGRKAAAIASSSSARTPSASASCSSSATSPAPTARSPPIAQSPRSCGCRSISGTSTSGAAMRAMIDGDLEEAERLAERGARPGERAEQPLADQFYGIQLSQLRRMQGRTDELMPRRPRDGRALPGDPGLAHRGRRPGRALRASRARAAGVRAVRGRRLLRDPPRRHGSLRWPDQRGVALLGDARRADSRLRASCFPSRAW